MCTLRVSQLLSPVLFNFHFEMSIAENKAQKLSKGESAEQRHLREKQQMEKVQKRKEMRDREIRAQQMIQVLSHLRLIPYHHVRSSPVIMWW